MMRFVALAAVIAAVAFVEAIPADSSSLAAAAVAQSTLVDDVPTRSCYFEGKDEICPVCKETERKNGIVTCKEWEEQVNPKKKVTDSNDDDDDDAKCLGQFVQCGSRNDTAFSFNPERDNKTMSPCCKDFACKQDPVLSVGKLKEAFFCTNCTKPLQRCAGEFNRTYIDYAPCCYNATTPHECVKAPALGTWGNFCVPAVPGSPEPTP